MGAYGNTGQAGMFGNKADFDVNGTVELADLTELLSEWLQDGDMIVNLDRTGKVDAEDFAIFSQNWLRQTD